MATATTATGAAAGSTPGLTGRGRLAETIVAAMDARDERQRQAAEDLEIAAWRANKNQATPPAARKPITLNGWVIAAIVAGLFVLAAIFLSPSTNRGPQSGPGGAPTSTGDARSPFIDAAPSGHHFVGATKGANRGGKDGSTCESRGGQIVPDTSKPMINTGKGLARPNKCTAD